MTPRSSSRQPNFAVTYETCPIRSSTLKGNDLLRIIGNVLSTRQVGLLLAAIAIAVSVYVFAVRHFQQDALLQQHTFGVGSPPADRLEVSAQIMSVSPVKDSLQVRFGFKPFGKYAADRFGRFASDVTVILATAEGFRPVHLTAGEIPGMLEKDIELDEGSPNDYPFDRYTAQIGISAFAHSNVSGGSTPVSTVVHYEKDLGNYAVTAGLGPDSTHASVDVRLFIWRSAAILTFSIMMYAAMVLVSTSALILTILVVLRRIDPDFGMMLWSGALLFALPAVRNSLPDSPPLGIQADFYIFMWAESVVAVSMVMLTSYLIAKRARGEPSSTA